MASPAVIECSDSEIDFDRLASRWEWALDAAQNAVVAAAHAPGVGLDLTHAQHDLVQERVSASALLAQAAGMHARPAPWLAPVPVTPRLLGLPADVKACLFDLDGVLTDSGLLHAQAWAEVFDSFLLRLAEQVGWQFVPFDPVGDYRSWIDGRPRLEGVHAFLASRGIRLPEGKREDPADAETAQGLARHKAEVLQRRIAERGVTALPDARRYLVATGYAGLMRAVVSASATAAPMLTIAGLAQLVDARVDAEVLQQEQLHARPAPDVLLAACRRLNVRPEEAVTLTHSPAGVAAGQAAGVAVIGIGRGELGELLAGFGAPRVVGGLTDLLDPSLRETGRIIGLDQRRAPAAA